MVGVGVRLMVLGIRVWLLARTPSSVCFLPIEAVFLAEAEPILVLYSLFYKGFRVVQQALYRLKPLFRMTDDAPNPITETPSPLSPNRFLD